MKERSHSIPRTKRRPPEKGLPQFGVALSQTLREKGRKIRPSTGPDSLLAQSFYEKIQAEGLLRQEKIIRIAKIIQPKLNSNRPYLQTCQFNEARLIFEFFETIGIKKDALEVRYLPSSRYDQPQADQGYLRWVSRDIHCDIQRMPGEKCAVNNSYGCLRIFLGPIESKTGRINLRKALAFLLTILC